jgi:hypothetical protein
LLDNSIQAKNDDVLFLEKALDAQRLWNEINPLIHACAATIFAKSKLPKFMTTAGGELQLSGWEENSVAKEIATNVLADIPVLCFRVISLVEARDYTAVAKTAAKKQLHQQADAEMADATKPGPLIQALINKAVAAWLKLPKGGPKVSHPPLSMDYLSHGYRLETYRQEREENGNTYPQEGLGRSQALSAQGRQKAASRHQDGAPQTHHQGQREREGQEQRLKSSALGFRYDHPSSYPDWLLTVSLRVPLVT